MKEAHVKYKNHRDGLTPTEYSKRVNRKPGLLTWSAIQADIYNHYKNGAKFRSEVTGIVYAVELQLGFINSFRLFCDTRDCTPSATEFFGFWSDVTEPRQPYDL